MEDLNGTAQAAAEYVVLPEDVAAALDEAGRDGLPFNDADQALRTAPRAMGS